MSVTVVTWGFVVLQRPRGIMHAFFDRKFILSRRCIMDLIIFLIAIEFLALKQFFEWMRRLVLWW